MSAVGTDLPPRSKQLILLEVLTLWHSNLSISRIAKKLHITRERLREYAALNKFPPRPDTAKKAPQKEVDPTPEEIQIRAAEIRARRTPEENRRLSGGRYRRVEIRQYAFDGRNNSFMEIS